MRRTAKGAKAALDSKHLHSDIENGLHHNRKRSMVASIRRPSTSAPRPHNPCDGLRGVKMIGIIMMRLQNIVPLYSFAVIGLVVVVVFLLSA